MKKMSLQRVFQILPAVLGIVSCRGSETNIDKAALLNEVAVSEDYLINSAWLSEVRNEPVLYLKVAYQASDTLFMRLSLVPDDDKIYVTGNGFLHEKSDVLWAEGWADSSQLLDIQVFVKDSLLIGQLKGKLSDDKTPLQFISANNKKPILSKKMDSREKNYFLSRISPLLSLKLTACPNKTMHYFGINPLHSDYKLWVTMQTTKQDNYVPQALFIANAENDDIIQYVLLEQGVPITAKSLPEMTRKSRQYFDLQDINQDNYSDIRFMEMQTAGQKMYRYLIYDKEEDIFLPLPLAANDYFRAQK
jgi:hypothetical protein